MQICFYAVNVK